MKTISKLITGTFVLLSISTVSQAQAVSATATATATIVAPITISKFSDMNFGNVAVGTALGTVVLDPALIVVRTPTGGVRLPAAAGSPLAAAFDITGEGTDTYAITLPAGATSLTSGSSTPMSVDTWTSTPSPTGTLTAGAQRIYVGATLHVGASQTAGVYTSPTPFTVTVNYN